MTANPTFRTEELRYGLKQSGAGGLFISKMNGPTPAEPIAVAAAEGLAAIREITLLENAVLWAGDGTLPNVMPIDPA